MRCVDFFFFFFFFFFPWFLAPWLDYGFIDRSRVEKETLYFCNITLGTPEQSLRLVLDTGSSDLWCNAANSTLCSSLGSPCRTSGSYDGDSSSTYSYVSSNFNISYADGSGAVGDYVTDTIRIGGITLKDFQFGVGYSSSSSGRFIYQSFPPTKEKDKDKKKKTVWLIERDCCAEGVLGIGYASNEVQVGRFGQNAYPNLPRAMVENGLISSNAYSLWLNDLEANTGSILFGGVNKAKYIGDLKTLPVQTVDGGYSEFIIALTGVAFASESDSHSYSSNSLPAAVLLDSGSSLTYLPDSLVEDIYSDLNVVYEASSGVGYVPCSLADESINITYTFSDPSITVGMGELTLDSGPLYFRDGTRACVFGIVPAGDSTAVLGDTFLRSAYVVYDLANNEISLANTNFDPADDDILEIGTGDDSVPGATRVANPVTTVAVDNGSGARIGGPTGSVSTELPTATSAATAISPDTKGNLLRRLASVGVGCMLLTF